MSYNASNIKVLDGIELAELPYMEINAITQKYYNSLSPEFVKLVSNAWEACQLAGLDFHGFYVERYLKKNSDVPFSYEFNEIYKDIK